MVQEALPPKRLLLRWCSACSQNSKNQYIESRKVAVQGCLSHLGTPLVLAFDYVDLRLRHGASYLGGVLHCILTSYVSCLTGYIRYEDRLLAHNQRRKQNLLGGY